MSDILLTQYSKSSGCGCKIAPAVLQGILGNKTTQVGSKVLVGIESFDDATIIELNETNCIISTTDFFTPIVNDAFDFGCIAAANSISDVYAMGGKPISAISVLGFPVDKLPVETIKAIMAGAQQKCEEAGITISGGHSIDSPEPFFGLCVTGVINKANIKRNNTASEGDVIYISKPLGTGIFSTAIKRGQLADTDYPLFFKNASELNSIGEILGAQSYINAMTDITGFGLLGHLVEMCEGSNLTGIINASSVPKLANLEKYIAQFCVPDNTYRNWNAIEKKITGITPESFITFNDPQTNGGLLIAVKKESVETFTNFLTQKGIQNIVAIGNLKKKGDFIVEIKD